MKKLAAAILTMLLMTTCTLALAQWATVFNPDPADRLNLRAEPSVDAISYGKYYNGTMVQILSGPRNGWYHVRVGLGNGVSEVEGYMMARYLAVGDEVSQVEDMRPVVMVDVPGEEYVLLKDFYTGSNVGKVMDGQNIIVLGVGTKYLHVVSGSNTGLIPVDVTTPKLSFSSEE